MKLARTHPGGYWPTPHEQRGWWRGWFLRIGRFKLTLEWHDSNTGSRPE